MSGNLFEDIEQFFDQKANSTQDTLIKSDNSNLVTNNSDNNIVKPAYNSNDMLNIFYSRLEEQGLSLDELKDILECPGNLLIVSAAGSGKTTALILKIIRDLVAGETMKVVDTPAGKVMIPANILVVTFLRSGAEELKKTFNDWCSRLRLYGLDSSTIKFSTIHAEVYSALKQMGVNAEVLTEVEPLIRSVMQTFKVRSVMSYSRNITADEVADVANILTYARNRLDDKRYSHALMDEYGLDAFLLDNMLESFKLRRRATGKMDFEDMQEILLEGLKVNPAVRDFIASRYDYIYIDEFQDTSQLQYEILKYYAVGCKKVLAVGDEDQTIYSWRGSDIDIISSRFEEDFSPTVKQLTMNYRCARNILNAVVPSIELNTKRHKKQLRSAVPDGEINIVMDGDVNSLLKGVREDLSKGYTIGVLARTNADLLIPAILLELDGTIDFAVSKHISLDSRIPRQVLRLLDLVTKRHTENFESLFKLFLPRNKHYEAEKLDNILRVNKNQSLLTISEEDLKYSLPNLFPVIYGLREAMKQDEVFAYLFLLNLLTERVYTGDSVYNKRAADFTNFIKKIIMEHDKVKNMNIHQIDDLFNHALPERLARRVKYGRGIFLQLSTVHEAKGKEWDSVYIWNDVEGSFPNYVGNRELSQEELEEERRIHYIAWTRARKKLTVFTESCRQGTFLKECNLEGVSLIAENKVEDKKVVFYKQRKDDFNVKELDLERILRGYIIEIQDTCSFTDKRAINVELVLAHYSINDLVERLEDSIDVMEYTEKSLAEYLDEFFSDLADEIMLGEL